jgi:hypothetical protein
MAASMIARELNHMRIRPLVCANITLGFYFNILKGVQNFRNRFVTGRALIPE